MTKKIKTVWKFLCILMFFSLGWVIAPYLFTFYMQLFPPIRDGYTINLHLYGSSRWIVAVSLSLTVYYFFHPLEMLRWQQKVVIFLWNLVMPLTLSIATDLQLWYPSFVQVNDAFAISNGRKEMIDMPLMILAPFGPVPIQHDNDFNQWTYAEAFLPFYLLYVVGIILLQMIRTKLSDLLFSINRSESIKIKDKLIFFVLYINWIQILPFPFENAEAITYLVLGIPLALLLLLCIDYFSIKVYASSRG